MNNNIVILEIILIIKYNIIIIYIMNGYKHIICFVKKQLKIE